MKKLMMILAILIAFTASASAQVPSSPVKLYAGGALSIPTGGDAFKTTFKNGYHGMVGVGFGFGPMFEMVGKVEYHTFKLDFDAVGMDGYTGGNNKMWMYGADMKFSPSLPALPISPYVLGGIGVASISQSELQGPSSLSLSLLNEVITESQSKFYWNMGAGFNLKTGPAFSLFCQARYVNIATDYESASFIPVTVGLRFF